MDSKSIADLRTVAHLPRLRRGLESAFLVGKFHGRNAPKPTFERQPSQGNVTVSAPSFSHFPSSLWRRQQGPTIPLTTSVVVQDVVGFVEHGAD